MITGPITKEMTQATENKFKAWDNVVAQGYLSGSSSQQKEALDMLNDPTIFFYAFFKDINDSSKPFKFYPYQDIILNDTSGKIIFAAANQIGKSITLCGKAVHYSLLHPGSTVLLVSKTLPQSKDLLRQIKQMLNSCKADYKFDVGEGDNKTEIYFRHYNFTSEGVQTELPQSRIICVPATEGSLGYAAHLLLVDELAFYQDGRYVYFQLLQPRTYATKGQIIVFSNPNGQQGVFWELWNNPEFSRYNFNFLDKPGNTIEEYEKLRKSLTREEFDSTVNAEFTNPAGGFITYEERKAIQEDRPNYIPTALTEPVYIFFDFAKSQDRTVRVCGIPLYNKEGERVGVYVYEMKEYEQGTEYNIIVDELKEFINEIGVTNIALVGWDNTGVGAGIESFIKIIEEVGVLVVPVDFTLESKSKMYTLFKLLVEKTARNDTGIKIPYVPECDKQLAQLRFKKSSRGYLQVHHENERDRDDFPDAIAGICALMLDPEYMPVSVSFIGD